MMFLRPTTLALLSSLAMATMACSADSEDTMPAPDNGDPGPTVEVPDMPERPDDTPEEETQQPMSTAPGEGLCGALLGLADSGEEMHECVPVMADDCQRIVDTLNDPYVDAVEQCIDDGGDIFECMTDSVEAFAKTPAHEDLATTFCDECAFGAPGCEEVFYINDSDWGLGTLLLPFSNEVLDTVATECADGFTCSIDFPSCAMDVIKDRLNVDASRECLMDIL